MKNPSTPKLFLVYKNSSEVFESSLNNFKPPTGLFMHSDVKASLRNAGVNLSKDTQYSFPEDRLMYVGFTTLNLAQQHSHAQQRNADRKVEETKLSTQSFIQRWKTDMKDERHF